MTYLDNFQESLILAEEAVKEWFNPSSPHLPSAEEWEKKFPRDEITKKFRLEELAQFGLDGYAFYGRRIYNQYSWPILNEINIMILLELIPAGARVLEVGAGLGWLAFFLQSFDVNFIAITDNKEWKNHSYVTAPVKIIKLAASTAMKKYQDADVILCSWPPYGSIWPTKLMKLLRPNQSLLYIGESWGGCNANDSFFEMWGEYRGSDHWEKFFGIKDRAFLVNPKKEE